MQSQSCAGSETTVWVLVPVKGNEVVVAVTLVVTTHQQPDTTKLHSIIGVS
ncbi:PLATZ transcription factor family protein [Zea mays]|jgi:hypothetical protein|uniref:PLATZ transcription factor family protein n=1 Tax=Zea mays TaxID=4577 RepID=A0A1D6JBZ2_MAIZE|nr:PLATZ transcription factor family protein [Zea mays]